MMTTKELLSFRKEWTIGYKDLNFDSTIRVDMGLDGDDILDFLKALEDRFKINLSEYFEKNFHYEKELHTGCLFPRKVRRPIATELTIQDLYALVLMK